MNLLTLDFETFYSKDYSLSKMTNEAYIRDPRFETIMVGLKLNDRPAIWVPKPQVAAVFNRIPWNETIMVCHHTHFDDAILSWVYGHRPALICDTLSMFRACYPTESASLDNMTKVLGLPPKGHEVSNAIGYRFADFAPEHLARYGAYCVNDVERTREAFDIMRPYFPLSELKLIDLTTRLFTEPCLHLNKALLQVAYDDEQERLIGLFAQAFPELHADAYAAVKTGDLEAWKRLKRPLSSNPQFAQMLLDLGVDPPKKLSPAAVKAGIADPDMDREPPIGMLAQIDKKTLAEMHEQTGEHHDSEIWTYAFSKADEDFKHLLEHENPQVSQLVEARLGVKSTIKETRAKAFMGIAKRGNFPIYLKYYGGHTGRFGGGDKVNPQNLNRSCPACGGDEKGCPKCGHTGVSPMRRAIEAPEGHVIVVRDLSAIEARVNFWLAGQEDKIQAYRDKKDLYCLAASQIFGREIVKHMKLERFLGKAMILGCGFGLGWKKLQGMLRVGMLGNAGMLLGAEIAASLGVSGQAFTMRNSGFLNESLPPGVSFDDHATHCACAAQIIKLFRDNNAMVPKLWDNYNWALKEMFEGRSGTIDPRGLIGFNPDGFVLPNGMMIWYTELQRKEKGRRHEYSILKNKRKGERAKVYGGLTCENITQGTARIILTDAMLRMKAEGIRVVHQVHDEILVVAPEHLAEKTYHRMGEIMSTPPSWAPDLPLASEGGWARQYVK